MSEPIRILIVEDLLTDAELAMREIRVPLPDCIFKRLDTESTYLEALEQFKPDLILSDYHMPRFTGMQALKLAQEHAPLTPLIIYTGSLSEDIAADCMRAGAVNYIIKENLKRLGTAVVHALEEKKVHIERKQMEQALQESEKRFRTILQEVPTIAVQGYAMDGTTQYWNSASEALYGYSAQEALGQNYLELIIPPEMRSEVRQAIQQMVETGKPIPAAELSLKRKDGSRVTVYSSHSIVATSGHAPELFCLDVDLTQRKQDEEKIRRQIDYLTAMQDIDRAIAATFEMHPNLNALISKAVSLLKVDAAAVVLVNYSMNSLEFATGNGFRTDAIEKAKLKIGEGYTSRVVQEHRIVKIPDLKNEADNPFLTGFFKEEGFASYYGAPLIVKGKVIGVLEVFHRSFIKRDQEWLDFLNALAGQAAVAISNAQLFEHLQQSNKDLLQAYDATIEGWSRAMDLRDKETEGHTMRVTEMNLRLARLLHVSAAGQVHIRRGSLLHDIGKLGVPDAILLKPGKLTAKEWEIMRQHPTHAYEMLSSVEYLKPALDIPYCHHEKWDGTGYPRGLKGEQIPLVARIFAIVDVWDALRSDRPYRAAWTYEAAREYVIEQSGKHFESRIVEAFLKMLDESPELY